MNAGVRLYSAAAYAKIWLGGDPALCPMPFDMCQVHLPQTTASLPGEAVSAHGSASLDQVQNNVCKSTAAVTQVGAHLCHHGGAIANTSPSQGHCVLPFCQMQRRDARGMAQDAAVCKHAGALHCGNKELLLRQRAVPLWMELEAEG